MSAGTGLATEKKKPTLIEIVNGATMKEELAKVLPKHMTADRFARICLTAFRKTPKLLQCTQESVLSCMMSLSQYGLEPDGRRAHLIPFDKKNREGKVLYTECTLILDYKGLVELAMRSGLVSTIHADVLYEGDLFEYDLGVIKTHVPWFLRRDKDKPKDPGLCLGVYAIYHGKDGSSKSEVLSIKEVDGIMARSKSKDNGPWQTDWSEMAKKTAFKRLSKWMVLSSEFRTANVDDDEGPLVLDRDMLKKLGAHIEPEKTKIGAMLSSGSFGDEDPMGYTEDDDRDSGRNTDEPEVKAGTGPESPKKAKLVSHMTACVEWLKAQEGVKLSESDPETGKNLFDLPNERILMLSEAKIPIPEGIDVVVATDEDALKQCQNIVDDSRKAR